MRDHYDRYERYDRHNDKSKNFRGDRSRPADASRKRKDERNDKFQGSLSEGLKQKDSSSGSEMGDIDLNDDDDEEKIIAMRRKREELMKVSSDARLFNSNKCWFIDLPSQKLSTKDTRSQPVESMTDESCDVIFVEDRADRKSFKNIFPPGLTENKPIKSPTPPPSKDDDDDKEQSTKAKTDGNGATKRTDWDMFAEQDIDSNFDVRNEKSRFFLFWMEVNMESICFSEPEHNYCE